MFLLVPVVKSVPGGFGPVFMYLGKEVQVVRGLNWMWCVGILCVRFRKTETRVCLTHIVLFWYFITVRDWFKGKSFSNWEDRPPSSQSTLPDP